MPGDRSDRPMEMHQVRYFLALCEELNFTRAAERSNVAQPSLTRAIIAMAQSLRLRTVAEGVESREQMEFLRLHDCDEIQGYYFSKPLPYAQLVEKLLRHADEQHVKPAPEREALPIVVWP